MSKILFVVFLVLLLIILAEAGFYFYLNLKQKPAPTSSSFAPNQKPTPPVISTFSSSPLSSSSPSAEFKILHQDPGDQEGRTILYTSAQKNLYNGSGLKNEPGKRVYLIGLFEAWQRLDKSKDRLMIIRDPLANNQLYKGRILFEAANQSAKPTWLSVENLEKAKSLTVSPNLDEGTEDYDRWLVAINSLSPEQLDQLLKKGDAVIVYPYQEKVAGEWQPRLDKDNLWLIKTILIRRQKGGAMIQ